MLEIILDCIVLLLFLLEQDYIQLYFKIFTNEVNVKENLGPPQKVYERL